MEEKKLKVFVASSSKQIKEGIADLVINALDENLSVTRWKGAFDIRKTTIEYLPLIASEHDAGVFIFAADDRLVSDDTEETKKVTRDNVIFECGLFVGRLGRDRVFIVQEADVVLPSDLDGMYPGQFKKSDDDRWKSELQLAVNEINEKIVNVSPKLIAVDAYLGFGTTLSSQLEENNKITNLINEYNNNKIPVTDNPISFDSRKSCIITYAEALVKTKSRFVTTTFLDSGFWVSINPMISEANDKMMKRVASKDGEIKRLFLLRDPPKERIQSYSDIVIQYRRKGLIDDITSIKETLNNIKLKIQRMKEGGCQVKIVHPKSPLSLPDKMEFDPRTSELAIYDDWRVDVFGGSTGIIDLLGGPQVGTIFKVHSFTQATEHFSQYLQQANDLFDGLWNSERCMDIDGFLNDIDRAINYAEERIDYETNWLSKYEYDLSSRDEGLKTTELNRVKEQLREVGIWKKIDSILDVGTCTARYPIELLEGVKSNGFILGIDNDPDCVAMANARVKEALGETSRVTIERVNFVASEISIDRKFKIITCMLGTISHFGIRMSDNEPYEDHLQIAISRFAELLDDEGFLFIGNWSQNACEKHDMLGIYNQADVRNLKHWTPSDQELRKRLEFCGLEVELKATPEPRLDFYCCRLTSKKRKIK